MNIGRENCCHVLSNKTHDKSCNFVRGSLEFLCPWFLKA